jgi:type IV secretory pathway ATPase VirB11/archaellum biosynthesis ATPase
MIKKQFKFYLDFFAKFLDNLSIEEISIDSPGRVFCYQSGAWVCYKEDSLSAEKIADFINLVKIYSHWTLNGNNPFCFINLFDVFACEVFLPPCVLKTLIIIRNLNDKTDKDFEDFFENISDIVSERNTLLVDLAKRREWRAFCDEVVSLHKKIFVSGSSFRGVEMFARALLQKIPECDRLVIIEDTSEFFVDHKHLIRLRYSKERSIEELIDISLRLSPDILCLSAVSITYDTFFSVLSKICSMDFGLIVIKHGFSFPLLNTMLVQMQASDFGAHFSRDEMDTVLKKWFDVFFGMEKRYDVFSLREVSLFC